MNIRCLPFEELRAIWQKNGWGEPEEFPEPLVDHSLCIVANTVGTV